ncbi:MAG: carbonic anhydrase [Bdellovibrionales bacterium]
MKHLKISLLFPFVFVFSNSWATTGPAAVQPEQALTYLQNGNLRFLKPSLRRDGQAKKDVQRLSSGQNPHSVVVSCSDSRVPPEIVFDQKLGELFVIRTAGQSLDDNAVGSVEYAVEHLGTRLLTVMGHTSCGAVTAALKTLDGSTAGSPALDSLLEEIHPRIKMFKGQEPSSGVEKESLANATGVAHDLIKQSKVIAKKWESGELWIVPSLYNLKTGEVKFMPRLMNPTGREPTKMSPNEEKVREH